MNVGKLISFLLVLVFWALPLIKGAMKAKRTVVAQPAAADDELGDDESWEESYDEEEEEFWEEDQNEIFEEELAENPFKSYFTYEAEKPEVTENPAPQAEAAPVVEMAMEENREEEAFEFDLRKAVIYQTILENNYLSEWK